MAKVLLKVNKESPNGSGSGDNRVTGPVPNRTNSNISPFGSALPFMPPATSEPPAPATIKLTDNRSINPATGTPFKTKGTKGIKADLDSVKAIIAHAKAKGVDPKTAIAIALQETNIGQLNPNYGSAWATFEDEGLPDDRNKNANILAKAIKEKMAYAKELRGKGIIPQGEEYDLQTYNGLGLLKPQQTVGGTGTESYYGIPVTAQQPLNLKKNPAYGKIVKQLRDEVVGNNPEILKLIESTPAYGQTESAPQKKVMLQVRK
jgi:hypothetical protein